MPRDTPTRPPGVGAAGAADSWIGKTAGGGAVRLERADPAAAKGWYAGPWNADLPIAVGYANTGIDAPHAHARMTEIYLVACGTATARVEARTVALVAGDVLIVEPGEAHTFLASSPDYRHFVIHAPALPPDEARADHVAVPRARVGL